MRTWPGIQTPGHQSGHVCASAQTAPERQRAARQTQASSKNKNYRHLSGRQQSVLHCTRVILQNECTKRCLEQHLNNALFVQFSPLFRFRAFLPTKWLEMLGKIVQTVHMLARENLLCRNITTLQRSEKIVRHQITGG